MAGVRSIWIAQRGTQKAIASSTLEQESRFEGSYTLCMVNTNLFFLLVRHTSFRYNFDQEFLTIFLCLRNNDLLVFKLNRHSLHLLEILRLLSEFSGGLEDEIIGTSTTIIVGRTVSDSWLQYLDMPEYFPRSIRAIRDVDCSDDVRTRITAARSQWLAVTTAN